MIRWKKTGIIIALFACMMAVLSACGDEPTPSPSPTPDIMMEEAAEGASGGAANPEDTPVALTDPTLEPEVTPELTKKPEETKKPDGKGETKTYPDITGKYELVATELYGMCVDVRNQPEIGEAYFVLKEDGTGTFVIEGDKEKITWKLKKNNKLVIVDKDGNSSMDDQLGTITDIVYENDVIIFKMKDEDAGEGASYFAREGTDLSWLKMISMDEFMKSEAQGESASR